MLRQPVIVDVNEVPAEANVSIGRPGRIVAKTFPLDTGVPGVGMEFTWISHSAGYGGPRHKHTFDQFRYGLSGIRQFEDGDVLAGQCGYFPEGVPYGPQYQLEEDVGLTLQFEGPSRIHYFTHGELDMARQNLIAEGGTFSKGIYTRVFPDGRKINKDSHAACQEFLRGHSIEYPQPRFNAPVIMRPENCQWVADRRLPGVEHKHLGTFTERRSGVRLTQLAPGGKIPAHVQEDAEILYLIEGSVNYAGKTWQGGKTETAGTYMFTPHNSDVKEITSDTGGLFFVISLPMLADIEAEIKSGRDRSVA